MVPARPADIRAIALREGGDPDLWERAWRAAESWHGIRALNQTGNVRELYRPRPDIRAAMRERGMTNKDLAGFLGMPPGTLGSKLCGYTALRPQEEMRILEIVKQVPKAFEQAPPDCPYLPSWRVGLGRRRARRRRQA